VAYLSKKYGDLMRIFKNYWIYHIWKNPMIRVATSTAMKPFGTIQFGYEGLPWNGFFLPRD